MQHNTVAQLLLLVLEGSVQGALPYSRQGEQDRGEGSEGEGPLTCLPPRLTIPPPLAMPPAQHSSEARDQMFLYLEEAYVTGPLLHHKVHTVLAEKLDGRDWALSRKDVTWTRQTTDDVQHLAKVVASQSPTPILHYARW